MLFKFEHNFYNHKGKNLATCDILGGWMDLKERKLTKLPQELLSLIKDSPKSKNFRVLTKEDTREFGKRPVDIT